MAKKNEPRPCATHDKWDGMDMKKKVETLEKWTELAAEWMEKTSTWHGNVKEVMDTLDANARAIIKVTKPFTGKGVNGGPPPPKAPKVPGC